MAKEELLVCKRRCNQCLFSPSKRIVSEERFNEVVKIALDADSKFLCHKNEKACCNGFYQRYKNRSLLIRLAIQLNLVKFV